MNTQARSESPALPTTLGTAFWALTDCFRATWLPVHPFPLDPLLASKADLADLPAPSAPSPQLLPKGLEWKDQGTVIWSREFSGDRLDPAFSGCYAAIYATFWTEKAQTCLQTANGLQLPGKPGKGQGPRPLGLRWATKIFIPLLPCPTPGGS